MGTCTICLEDFTKDDKTVNLDGCNHEVHSHCFFEYANYEIKHHKSVGCPNCRHIVINIPEPVTEPVQPLPLTPPSVIVVQDPRQKQNHRVITAALCFILGVNILYLININSI